MLALIETPGLKSRAADEPSSLEAVLSVSLSRVTPSVYDIEVHGKPRRG
ncbi:MAG: hypothetical protein ACKO9Q_25145 [Pirellula sp.]